MDSLLTEQIACFLSFVLATFLVVWLYRDVNKPRPKCLRQRCLYKLRTGRHVFDRYPLAPNVLLRDVHILAKDKVLSHLNEYVSGTISKATFLLYGDSGTGKTMLASGIAQFLGADVIDISFPLISDRLFDVFHKPHVAVCKNVGPRRVYLIEDIDKYCENVHVGQIYTILAAIDGVLAFNGVVVMTATDITRVHAKLTRYGRVMCKVSLNDITPEISYEVIKNKFPAANMHDTMVNYTPARLLEHAASTNDGDEFQALVDNELFCLTKKL